MSAPVLVHGCHGSTRPVCGGLKLSPPASRVTTDPDLITCEACRAIFARLAQRRMYTLPRGYLWAHVSGRSRWHLLLAEPYEHLALCGVGLHTESTNDRVCPKCRALVAR
jgi:hypothetical protein